MVKVLLISEDKIKTHSGLNENVWGKSLTPAIRESQDIFLQPILGSALYKSIIAKVEDGSIAQVENEAYKTLLDDYIQDYLMYQSISNLIPILGTKIVNLGVVTSTDEQTANRYDAEVDRLVAYYKYRSDFYAHRMQDFLKENYNAFPELKGCACYEIKENLDSAASTSLWLGGYRSKRVK